MKKFTDVDWLVLGLMMISLFLLLEQALLLHRVALFSRVYNIPPISSLLP